MTYTELKEAVAGVEPSGAEWLYFSTLDGCRAAIRADQKVRFFTEHTEAGEVYWVLGPVDGLRYRVSRATWDRVWKEKHP